MTRFLPQRLLNRLQRFLRFFGFGSACLGKVGTSAAALAAEGGNARFHELDGVEALCEVVRNADEKGGLAVVRAGQRDHA